MKRSRRGSNSRPKRSRRVVDPSSSRDSKDTKRTQTERLVTDASQVGMRLLKGAGYALHTILFPSSVASTFFLQRTLLEATNTKCGEGTTPTLSNHGIGLGAHYGLSFYSLVLTHFILCPLSLDRPSPYTLFTLKRQFSLRTDYDADGDEECVVEEEEEDKLFGVISREYLFRTSVFGIGEYIASGFVNRFMMKRYHRWKNDDVKDQDIMAAGDESDLDWWKRHLLGMGCSVATRFVSDAVVWGMKKLGFFAAGVVSGGKGIRTSNAERFMTEKRMYSAMPESYFSAITRCIVSGIAGVTAAIVTHPLKSCAMYQQCGGSQMGNGSFGWDSVERSMPAAVARTCLQVFQRSFWSLAHVAVDHAQEDD